MSIVDHQYSVIGERILRGVSKVDRTGVGTISTFGEMARYPLNGNKLALITSKKVHTKGFVHELLWFIKGTDRIEYLKENKIRIWDSWVKKGTEVYNDQNELVGGSLGPVYGVQWRSWEDTRTIPKVELQSYIDKGYRLVGHIEGTNLSCVNRKIDQLQNAIDQLRTNPDSRRILVSAWNPALVDEQALPPCHWAFQFYSEPMDDYEIYQELGKHYVDFTVPSEMSLKEFAESRGVPTRKLKMLLNMR